MERGWKVLATTSIGSFMVFVDTSILNVAFRDVVKDFGADQQQRLTWTFSAYSIAFASALLTAGRAGDRLGRKRVFLVGVVVFALASLGCAAAGSPNMLIGFRVLQAFGGALIVPAALALVLPEFPPEKRSTAIGISGAVGGLSAAVGPVLGGFLVDAFGWRSAFLINLPVSVIALAIGSRILRESRDASAVRFPDPLGGLLAMIGFGSITAAIVEGDRWGWRSPAVAGSVIFGIAMLGWLVQRCRTQPVPVVDLSLFSYKFFTAANLSAFLFSMGFYGMFITNVTFLQAVWGFSPLKSGLGSAPGPITAALLAGPAGAWASKHGHKKIIVPGIAIFCAGIAMIAALADTKPTYWSTFFIAYLITGAGVGLVISTLGSAANAYLPPNRFGMGSAVNSTGRQIGAALGVAAVTALRAAAGESLTGYRRAWIFIIISTALAGVAMQVLFVRPTQAQVDASR
jgi:EmrB/QacA subfamily drug resistance transporter